MTCGMSRRLLVLCTLVSVFGDAPEVCVETQRCGWSVLSRVDAPYVCTTPHVVWPDGACGDCGALRLDDVFVLPKHSTHPPHWLE